MSAAEALKEEEVVVAKFSFDDNFQSKIAALCIRDVNFARRCNGIIKPEYFESATESVLVSMANDYFDKYRCLPGAESVWMEMIKDAYRAKKIRKELFSAVVLRMRELIAGSVSDREFIIERVSTFAKHQAVQEAYLSSVDLVESGQFDKAQKIMQKAFQVGAMDSFQELNYWDHNSIEARAKRREDLATGKIEKRGIPTGVKKIDAMLYHGGWGRQELSCLMAGAKKGKSMGLGYFAGRASVNGKNVLYLTLEVSAEIIADREDACLSDTEMRLLGAAGTKISDKIKVYTSKGKEEKLGELRLIGFPSGTLRPSDIRRILEKYRADGVVFDLLVVDYADIMAPDHYTSDAQENSKQIWLGLRAIAFEEDFAVLTATQTNREGHKESTAKAEHAAEDFNKIRIADLVITINHTDEEKAKGDARLYFAASRNQAGDFALHIKQDMSKMQFITSVSAT